MSTEQERRNLIGFLLPQVSPNNQEWYANYMARNLDAIVEGIRNGQPALNWGFRGQEVKEAMQKLGIA